MSAPLSCSDRLSHRVTISSTFCCVPALPAGTLESARHLHLYLKTKTEVITQENTECAHTSLLFLCNANLARSDLGAGGMTPGTLSHVHSGTLAERHLP